MIVDCEGFEEYALSPQNIAHFSGWELIIEAHDGFSPGITKRLIEGFKTTHQVEVIEAIHDFDKIERIHATLLTRRPPPAFRRPGSRGRQGICLPEVAGVYSKLRNAS